MLLQLDGVDLVVEEPAIVVTSLELALGSLLERVGQIVVRREVERSLVKNVLEDSDSILSGQSSLLHLLMLPCTLVRQT